MRARIRVLALAVGLFLALTLSACEQPRPCLDTEVTVSWYYTTTAKGQRAQHPMITQRCVRYGN